MNGKMKAASEAYCCGCTCSQAVFSAYADEMGIEKTTGYRMMEGFGGGFGGTQEICGALTAVCAIISYYSSDGKLDGTSKPYTYQKIQAAMDIFSQEYGSITCKEILHGDKPAPFACGMKVKDSILIIEQLIKERKSEKDENHWITTCVYDAEHLNGLYQSGGKRPC